uniref:endonuclease toxin domain-containing protein n=1 Tax=Photorhabdus sp. RM322S TaxID=3342825 RepID=UPI0036D82F03
MQLFSIYGCSTSRISQREVHIAVPKATTPEQWVQINRAIAYGTEKNVNIKITVVK